MSNSFKGIINGTSAGWLRLLIQVLVLGALVCIAWGRLDSRVDTNKAGVADNKQQRRAVEIYMRNIDLRLGRIEGALEIRGDGK